VGDENPSLTSALPEVSLWRAVLARAVLDAQSEDYAADTRLWCRSPDFEVVADYAGVSGGVARERLQSAILEGIALRSRRRGGLRGSPKAGRRRRVERAAPPHQQPLHASRTATGLGDGSSQEADAVVSEFRVDEPEP
jgi:hypothetical protein